MKKRNKPYCFWIETVDDNSTQAQPTWESFCGATFPHDWPDISTSKLCPNCGGKIQYHEFPKDLDNG